MSFKLPMKLQLRARGRGDCASGSVAFSEAGVAISNNCGRGPGDAALTWFHDRTSGDGERLEAASALGAFVPCCSANAPGVLGRDGGSTNILPAANAGGPTNTSATAYGLTRVGEVVVGAAVGDGEAVTSCCAVLGSPSAFASVVATGDAVSIAAGGPAGDGS